MNHICYTVAKKQNIAKVLCKYIFLFLNALIHKIDFLNLYKIPDVSFTLGKWGDPPAIVEILLRASRRHGGIQSAKIFVVAKNLVCVVAKNLVFVVAKNLVFYVKNLQLIHFFILAHLKKL